MWKQLITLARGRSFEAAEAVADRHALAILRQQIRDGTSAVAGARQAIAVAVAQSEEEARQRCRIDRQIEDLETRAVSALEQDRQDLAREAAETIGRLEKDNAAAKAAQVQLDAEITRLRRVVADAQGRLRELQRGQRLAVAADRTQRLRLARPGATFSMLREAESGLERLRGRQREASAAAAALGDMDRRDDPAGLSQTLAAADCGAPLPSSTEAVLERLRQRMTRPD